MKWGRQSPDGLTPLCSTLAGPVQETVEFPAEAFRHRLMTQLVKHVRPPTRRDMGTKVLKLKQIVMPASLIDELLSTARGLPPEDEQPGLVMRLTPRGVVKPTKATPTGKTTKIKLQDPKHIKAFFSLDKHKPSRFDGATPVAPPLAQPGEARRDGKDGDHDGGAGLGALLRAEGQGGDALSPHWNERSR